MQLPQTVLVVTPTNQGSQHVFSVAQAIHPSLLRIKQTFDIPSDTFRKSEDPQVDEGPKYIYLLLESVRRIIQSRTWLQWFLGLGR